MISIGFHAGGLAFLVTRMSQAGRTDQGPEFMDKALDERAHLHGVDLKLIQADKPIQYSFVESFNGKLRDKCLNEHWFHSVEHARAILRQWRQDYNEHRPHSTMVYKTPLTWPKIHYQ